MKSFSRKANRRMFRTTAIPPDSYESAAGTPLRIGDCRLNAGGELPRLETTIHAESAPQLWFNVRATNNPNPGCRTSIADQTGRDVNLNLLSWRFALRMNSLARGEFSVVESGTSRHVSNEVYAVSFVDRDR